MTWSKVHTSSIQVDAAAVDYADQNYVEQLEEVFSWFAARGWTVTPKSDNSTANTANWWRLEKQMTSYEGVMFTSKWNFLQKRNGATSSLFPMSANYSLELMDETQNTFFTAYPASFFPTHTATGIECWQSDEDNDSMLIVSTFSTGERVCRGFFPAGNAIRMSGPTAGNSSANLYYSLLPLSHHDNLIKGTTWSQLYFGEVSHQHSSTYTSTVPVLTKGELGISNGDTSFARWRQSDVAVYETFSQTERFWDNDQYFDFGTMLIDGDYYIRLGDLAGSTVALLNCGSTNPNFNI